MKFAAVLLAAFVATAIATDCPKLKDDCNCPPEGVATYTFDKDGCKTKCVCVMTAKTTMAPCKNEKCKCDRDEEAKWYEDEKDGCMKCKCEKVEEEEEEECPKPDCGKCKEGKVAVTFRKDGCDRCECRTAEDTTKAPKVKKTAAPTTKAPKREKFSIFGKYNKIQEKEARKIAKKEQEAAEKKVILIATCRTSCTDIAL